MFQYSHSLQVTARGSSISDSVLWGGHRPRGAQGTAFYLINLHGRPEILYRAKPLIPLILFEYVTLDVKIQWHGPALHTSSYISHMHDLLSAAILFGDTEMIFFSVVFQLLKSDTAIVNRLLFIFPNVRLCLHLIYSIFHLLSNFYCFVFFYRNFQRLQVGQNYSATGEGGMNPQHLHFFESISYDSLLLDK